MRPIGRSLNTFSKMNIIIKNVTGDPFNDWCIWELKRAGYPEGSIVRNVKHDQENESCTWSSGADHCVAWLGQTCETIAYHNNVNIKMKSEEKSEETQSKIVRLSSKLAEHIMKEKHHVSQDMLFDENGNYHTKFQNEFCILYDEYYNELENLIYGK